MLNNGGGKPAVPRRTQIDAPRITQAPKDAPNKPGNTQPGQDNTRPGQDNTRPGQDNTRPRQDRNMLERQQLRNRNGGQPSFFKSIRSESQPSNGGDQSNEPSKDLTNPNLPGSDSTKTSINPSSSETTSKGDTSPKASSSETTSKGDTSPNASSGDVHSDLFTDLAKNGPTPTDLVKIKDDQSIKSSQQDVAPMSIPEVRKAVAETLNHIDSRYNGPLLKKYLQQYIDSVPYNDQIVVANNILEWSRTKEFKKIFGQFNRNVSDTNANRVIEATTKKIEQIIATSEADAQAYDSKGSGALTQVNNPEQKIGAMEEPGVQDLRDPNEIEDQRIAAQERLYNAAKQERMEEAQRRSRALFIAVVLLQVAVAAANGFAPHY